MRRTAFAELTKYLEASLELPSDALIAAEYRFAALNEAGFGVDGDTPSASGLEIASSAGSTNRYLDTEIVAAYW
jgi:hypothetical protein